MQKLFHLTELFLIVIVFTYFILSGCTKQVDDDKIAITTSSESAKEDFLKGRELFEKLRARESLQFFENAITKDKNFAMAYFYHSLANPTNKGFFEDLNNALINSEKASEGEKLFIQALKAGVDGDQKKQEEFLLKLVKVYPEDERAHFQIGQYYFGVQKFDLAVEHLKKCTELEPEYSNAYNMLGYSYRSLENYVEAEKAFKKYIELIPDDPNPYDSYAEMLSKVGRYEESIEQYKKALSINPSFFNSYMGISNNLIYMDKYEDAIENCNSALSKAKNDGEKRFALFTNTVAFVDAGKTNEALSEMNKQFEIAKNNNDPGAMNGDLNLMGNILFEAGKYDEAKIKFDDALKVIEDSKLADEVKENNRRLNLYNLGRIALKTGKIDEAKKLAEEFYIKSEKANNTFQIWLAHSLNGLIAMNNKDYKTAILEFEKSSQQNPQTFYYLAQAYQMEGNKIEAKKYAEKCANFNALININQSFVRNKAKEILKNV
jgi:tetratricopeptide (TPR) repeat protein